MYIETFRLENESLHLELMRREFKRRSSLSIKAQEFRPEFRFSIKAREFVPVMEIVLHILKEKQEEELKKKMNMLNEELKEELKKKELNQRIAPFSVYAKVFIPATFLYRYF